MIPKKIETLLITLIVINLSIVLVFSAMFEKKQLPVGVLMVTSAGTIKFNHLQHTTHGTKELECTACHHFLKDENEKDIEPPHSACRRCHYNKPVEESPCKDSENHTRCVGQKCNSCHVKKKCEFCHYR